MKRHVAFPGRKPQLVANFDPDVAGENAAAKTIDLLVEEGFNIKIVCSTGDWTRIGISENGALTHMQAVFAEREVDPIS